MQMLPIHRTLSSERVEAMDKARQFMTAAEKENRELTPEERAQVQAHLDAAKAIKDRIDALTGDDELRSQIAQFQDGSEAARALRDVSAPAGSVTRRVLSLGEQFVSSQLYRDGVRGKARPRGWTSGTIDLDYTPRAALLDSSGAGALIVPDYRPGLVEQRFARLVVADLIAPGSTDSSAIIYMEETLATNGAAAVAEGAPKPESALGFQQKTDLVKKIATWLPVTDEMLDDVPQLRSYIDGRLILFVQQEEEDQLLNGDGIGPNITGLRNRVGLAPDVAREAVGPPIENNADAIFRQVMAIANTSFVMPDGVVVNPANWQSVMLMKDANGNYQAGGPFNSLPQPRMWGLPVVVTPAMTVGVALVGAFGTAAQVFRKGGIAVEASNSHIDYFTKNLTAIRAEERLALAVYRPGAFGEVTGLL